MRAFSVLRAAPALVALAVGGMAACGGGGPVATPAPFDPTGMYDFTARLGTAERKGTLEIARTATGLDAEARVETEPMPALADSIVVDGRHVVIHTLIGGGDEVVFDLHFGEENSFDGYILVALDSIQVSGTRRAP